MNMTFKDMEMKEEMRDTIISMKVGEGNLVEQPDEEEEIDEELLRFQDMSLP